MTEPRRAASRESASRRRLLPLAITGGQAGRVPALTAAEPAGAGDAGAAAEPAAPGSAMPADVGRILSSLPTPALWVDAEGSVQWAHPSLEAMRLVRRGAIVPAEIARLVEQARGERSLLQDVSVRRPGRRQPRARLRVRVTGMQDGSRLVLIEDISEAERVDRVRRDFVANVSHELKTPVGALSLLAEAVADAGDDPEAVRRFSTRILAETRRMATLINDLMDLSRLEGIDPEPPAEPVSVDDVVSQACDDALMLARERRITFLRGGIPGLTVLGVESQLVTAVRNLVVNAISYSSPSTKVAVTTGVSGGWVTIAVTDQGIGIPPAEIDRIFERFYRVDPARSRSTGGTGLGLAIVKHVCANHGGDCDVWSRVGEGSTFTMRLPPGPSATEDKPEGRTRRPAKEDG